MHVVNHVGRHPRRQHSVRRSPRKDGFRMQRRKEQALFVPCFAQTCNVVHVHPFHDLLRAVAVVQINVDDGHFHVVLFQGVAHGHRHVVDQTKSLPHVTGFAQSFARDAVVATVVAGGANETERVRLQSTQNGLDGSNHGTRSFQPGRDTATPGVGGKESVVVVRRGDGRCSFRSTAATTAAAATAAAIAAIAATATVASASSHGRSTFFVGRTLAAQHEIFGDVVVGDVFAGGQETRNVLR